jgi:AraC family transcriptional regulator, regulatory protein of adaptative response / methylated-DNA-[protein]-cysteine methyltransferase
MLAVSLEAIAPQAAKTGGRGVAVAYDLHPTRFGPCLIATTAQGICNLHFLEQADPVAAEALLQQDWPEAAIAAHPQGMAALCDRIFAPAVGDPDPPLAVAVKGTDFQLQVWRALLPIPSGEVTTYQALARAIDRPTAARAVGNAVGRNPVAYLIPCHRVVRGSGDWGGYRWGAARKALMLRWEASQFEAQGA